MVVSLLKLPDSLTEFSDACDELKLSEREAYLALPSFLTSTAYVHHRRGVKSASVWNEPSSLGQRPLRSCSSSLLPTRQLRTQWMTCECSYKSPVKPKTSSIPALSKPASARDTRWDVNERINSLIDGLNPKIRRSVHVFREDTGGEQLGLQDIATRARLKRRRTTDIGGKSDSLSRNTREATRRSPRTFKSVSYADNIKEMPTGLHDMLHA